MKFNTSIREWTCGWMSVTEVVIVETKTWIFSLFVWRSNRVRKIKTGVCRGEFLTQPREILCIFLMPTHKKNMGRYLKWILILHHEYYPPSASQGCSFRYTPQMLSIMVRWDNHIWSKKAPHGLRSECEFRAGCKIYLRISSSCQTLHKSPANKSQKGSKIKTK